jgi:hypothetical protein
MKNYFLQVKLLGVYETFFNKKIMYPNLAVNIPTLVRNFLQGCQIFLGTTYRHSKNKPNNKKIYQIPVKYTNIFHSKALKNWPILGIRVCKNTIWQPLLFLYTNCVFNVYLFCYFYLFLVFSGCS